MANLDATLMLKTGWSYEELNDCPTSRVLAMIALLAKGANRNDGDPG